MPAAVATASAAAAARSPARRVTRWEFWGRVLVLPYLVVFTPDTKPYYCVEPVSHVSNAIHMAEPAAHGLKSVEPGRTVDAWMKLEVSRA